MSEFDTYRARSINFAPLSRIASKPCAVIRGARGSAERCCLGASPAPSISPVQSYAERTIIRMKFYSCVFQTCSKLRESKLHELAQKHRSLVKFSGLKFFADPRAFARINFISRPNALNHASTLIIRRRFNLNKLKSQNAPACFIGQIYAGPLIASI